MKHLQVETVGARDLLKSNQLSPESLARLASTTQDATVQNYTYLSEDSQRIFNLLHGEAPNSPAAKAFLQRFSDSSLSQGEENGVYGEPGEYLPDIGTSPPLFDTPDIKQQLSNALSETRREEIVEQHREQAKDLASSILDENELYANLCLGKAKSRAVERFYALLIEYALVIAHQNGRARATFITIFTSSELLAACTGYARQTLLNDTGYLSILRSIGVIDLKGHVSTYQGQNRYDGSLLCVQLKPSASKAKLGYHDWNHGLNRDFDAQKSDGKTVHQLKNSINGQSYKLKREKYEIKTLILYSLLDTSKISASVEIDCPYFKDELVCAVLDVPNVHYAERNRHINVLAGAICSVLNDQHSYKFWCSLLWKAHKYGVMFGFELFKTISNVISRACIAVKEGKRKGGAYAYELLKEFKVFSTLADAAI